MLNYNEDNPTCINLLKKSGQTVSDKKSIKALSTMTGAQVQMADKLSSYQGCIMPSESMKTLNISVTNKNCTLPNIANNYNLVYTSDGILSMNPQIQRQQIKKGEGIYPSKGCLYNLDDGNTNGLIEDVSAVIDSSNKQELVRLNQVIEDLKNECNDLDKLISSETNNLSNAINTLNNQINVCRKYKTDIIYYKNLTSDIKKKIGIETNNLNVANAQYQESVKSGQLMVQKCNLDIKHCFGYKDCNYSGVKRKLFGYIGNLQKYGFNEISSLKIPPGIEVRIFDDFEYVGGNSIFAAPLNSAGLEKACLVNEEYTQQIMTKDISIGGITITSQQRNWNDNIRSIRIRRIEDYVFNPAAVIETFENYNDTVKMPLTHLEMPGNIDPYFYGPANITVKRIGEDYLKNYTLYDNKDLLGGVLQSFKPLEDFDRSKYSDEELKTIPVQQCAKQCLDNKDKCDSFIYKPVEKTCEFYKKGTAPYISAKTEKCGNGSGSCKSYVINGILVENPPQIPEGPYKKKCSANDLYLAQYKNNMLTMTCNQKTSSIDTSKCVINSINTNTNNELICDIKPIDACPKSNDFCSDNTTMAYANIDCLRDGILGDHICIDSYGNSSSILRSNNCKNIEVNAPRDTCKDEWTKLKNKVPPLAACQKPDNFCSNKNKMVYANIDCRKDGIVGDHLCIDYRGNASSILRSNKCKTIDINAPRDTCKDEWDKLNSKVPKAIKKMSRWGGNFNTRVGSYTLTHWPHRFPILFNECNGYYGWALYMVYDKIDKILGSGYKDFATFLLSNGSFVWAAGPPQNKSDQTVPGYTIITDPLDSKAEFDVVYVIASDPDYKMSDTYDFKVKASGHLELIKNGETFWISKNPDHPC